MSQESEAKNCVLKTDLISPFPSQLYLDIWGKTTPHYPECPRHWKNTGSSSLLIFPGQHKHTLAP